MTKSCCTRLYSKGLKEEFYGYSCCLQPLAAVLILVVYPPSYYVIPNQMWRMHGTALGRAIALAAPGSNEFASNVS